MTHTYDITGMTCNGCLSKVHQLLSQVPGVTNVDINLEKGTGEITMEHHVNTTKLKEALSAYPKYTINEQHVTQQPIVTPFAADETETRSFVETYKPVLLIFGYVTGLSVLISLTYSGGWMMGMRVFMSGFFLIFSLFKMLNLPAFADSYAMYDIIAKKIRAWGYIYAFIELALGIAFAINFQPVLTNAITLVVMFVSIIGVLQSVLNKRAIQCACLGTVFNLPMSTITIIEDGLMIAMSAFMLLMM